MNFKLMITLASVIIALHGQGAVPPQMTVNGPINTAGIASIGSPLEQYASAANSFLTFPSANLTASWIAPGQQVVNSTITWTNFMNVFANFLYQYSINSEPLLCNITNQIFTISNQSSSISSQNVSNYTTASRAQYNAYLISAARNQTLNISNILNNTVNYINSVNALGNVSAINLASIQNLINAWMASQASTVASLVASNATMNSINNQLLNDWNMISNIQLGATQNFVNNATFLLITSNASLVASNMTEMTQWNASWTNGCPLFTLPSSCGADGFAINSNLGLLISSTYNAMQAATQQVFSRLNDTWVSNNQQLQLLDANVTVFEQAVNLLRAIASPLNSNNTAALQDLWNRTAVFLRWISSVNFTLAGPGFNQFNNSVGNGLQQVINQLSQAQNRIPPSSLDRPQINALIAQAQQALSGLPAALSVLQTALLQYPPGWNPAIQGPQQPLPFSGIQNYWNTLNAAIQPFAAAVQNIVNLQISINGASPFIQNTLFVNPASTATVVVPTQFQQAWGGFQNQFMPFANQIIGNCSMLLNNITQYLTVYGNFYQNLMVQQQGLKNRVLDLSQNFSNYLNVIGQQQLNFENAQNLATYQATKLHDIQLVQVSWLTHVISSIPVNFVSLPATTSLVNFRINLIQINQAFRQIDACLLNNVPGQPSACASPYTHYFAQDISRFNLTAIPPLFLSVFVSANATGINGTDGSLTLIPATNPLLFNAVAGITPPPAGLPAAPTSTPNYGYVIQQQQPGTTAPVSYAQYIINVISQSPSLIVFQLVTTQPLALLPNLIINATIAVPAGTPA
jgi:hypothetical protein